MGAVANVMVCLCLSLGAILKTSVPPDKLMGSGEHRAAGPILQWRRLKWVEIYPGHPETPGEAQGRPCQSILVTRGQSQGRVHVHRYVYVHMCVQVHVMTQLQCNMCL